VVNTATDQGTAPGAKKPVVSAPSKATIKATPVAAISLVKTATPMVFSYPGVKISYSFLVTNTGDVTLTKVGIDDSLPGLSAISCPQSSLSPGARETCTATYYTTQGDVNAGLVVNTATAHGTWSGASNPVVSPKSSVTIFYDMPARVPVTA
jgi:uncharacterized repeat protein (TIGR01451 family)